MLARLAARQSEWENMVRALRCPSHLVGDVIQEAYLNIHKYGKEEKVFNKDGTVNKFYMFVTLRNALRVEFNNKNKYVLYETFYSEEQESTSNDLYEKAFNDLLKDIQSESDSWGSYNSKLFNLYFKTDFSMRKIAKGTGIGVTHIYNSIKRYRETILDKFEEDYTNLSKIEKTIKY
tara:strand:+ start:276 stop:806 length:531 start_codon:yes stop_codon:yes gene_type:complete